METNNIENSNTEKNKHIAKNTAINLDLEVLEARRSLSVVESSLKQAISNHAEYVDKFGKKSTGPGGLAIQIKMRMKKAFGHGCDGNSLNEILLLKSLIVKLNMIFVDGEKEFKSRKTIKPELYSTIEKYGVLIGELS